MGERHLSASNFRFLLWIDIVSVQLSRFLFLSRKLGLVYKYLYKETVKSVIYFLLYLVYYIYLIMVFSWLWNRFSIFMIYDQFESSEFSQIVFCRITQITLLLPLAPGTNSPPKGCLNLWYVWCLLVSVNRNILVLVLRFVVNWKAFGFTSSGILRNKKLREHWYQLFDVAVVSVVFPDVDLCSF